MHNAVLPLTTVVIALASQVSIAEQPKATEHRPQQIEGWTVRIDGRLFAPAHVEFGKEATVLLADRLRDVKRSLRTERIKQLQRVVIQLDLTHGRLERMQYHPSREWLQKNGYDPALEQCVHVPVAANFLEPRHQQVQPWSVMHELAHAYHDQVLGFEDRQVLEAWQAYRHTGGGNDVLHVDGERTEHYALTDHKEFFAEMSEAYLGRNDFYPFVRGELREDFPEVYRLMRAVWGPLK